MKIKTTLTETEMTPREIMEAVDNTAYWVISDGDAPERIYFSWHEANLSRANYIDGFNKDGFKVIAFMLNRNGEYTTEF